ncbi:MAG: alpha-L-fucosidase [Eubacteriales bacterium]
MSFERRKTPGNTEWFVQDRFGMFIHFGLYAMPARHEWVKHLEKTPEDMYDIYFKYFNPDMFDAKEWAKQAKAAGMKYAVITTKHHEGFCLFDSQHTDYKITNTPFGRDLIKEYADAFRAEGLKVGFYYSLIDWHHPDFPIDPLHPRRYDENAAQLNEGRDVRKYAKYMRDQVSELLTNYGKVDILWFDFSYSGSTGPQDWMKGKGKVDWEAEELLATARSLQPEIIIDNRTEIEQDLWTPEQYQPRAWLKHEETGELVTWEACQTFSGSWGYFRDEYSWKSVELLIKMLIDTVSKGGNLLLNVGPTSRGYFDSRAVDALNGMGKWMKYNSRSIYGCTQSEFTAPLDCRYTQNGKKLYLHIMSYPFKSIFLEDIADKVEYMQFLHDGSEIKFHQNVEGHHHVTDRPSANQLVIELPQVKPDTEVPVVEIFLK